MGGGTGTGIPEGMATEEYFRRNPPGRTPEKRIISLGFREPKELESKVIYVTLNLGRRPAFTSPSPYFSDITTLDADLISDCPFKHLDNIVTPLKEGGKCHIGREICQVRQSEGDLTWRGIYNRFLEDLVKSNNGAIDYSRMMLEGAEAYYAVRHESTKKWFELGLIVDSASRA